MYSDKFCWSKKEEAGTLTAKLEMGYFSAVGKVILGKSIKKGCLFAMAKTSSSLQNPLVHSFPFKAASFCWIK